MLTIKNDNNSKLHTGKAIIGFDLGNTFSQISLLKNGADEPETISVVTGTEAYNIPTVLAKRPGVGQWFYGREAVKYANNGGILVDSLVEKAIRGEEVVVDNESYDPIALLALFVKRCMGLLNMHVSAKDVEGYMFTVEELSTRMVEVLNKLLALLNLKSDYISYLSHVESIYYYMIHQSRELWQYQVLVLEYNEMLKSMCFECSKNTEPKVAFIHSENHASIQRMNWSEDEAIRQVEADNLDANFLNVVQGILNGRDVTTVYLLGDGFKEEWAKDSLKVLCKNRRVFQGNNLYSKGACLGLRDRLHPSEVSKEHVYLGEEKVKSNIGMRALRGGADSYFAILDAGVNWFEASTDFEIILDEGDEVPFVITSLIGGRVSEKIIKLDGLPVRPKGTTLLHIHIEMSRVDVLEIEIEDLGFGQIIKSSGRAWTQTINL